MIRARLALAALSGLLLFAAFPGVGAWPLAFVAWAPLLLALEGVSRRRAALLGFVAGLAATLPAFRFLYPVLRAQSGFGPFVCALLVVAVAAWHALRGLVVGLVARADAARPSGGPASASAATAARPASPASAAPAAGAPASSPIPRAAPATPAAAPAAGPPSLLFVAGLALAEIALPSLFPWYLGASVHDVPLLLQVAEIGGPVAISVLLGLGSLAVAETVSALRAERRTRPRVILPALAIPIVAAFWGSLRIPEIDARTRAAPTLTAGVVQPNVTGEGEVLAVQRLRDASHDLAGKGADLVVWPEGALPWTVPAHFAEETFAMLRPPAVPILTGALVQGDPGAAGPPAAGPGEAAAPPADPAAVPVTNSALLFDAAGRLTGRYDKHHLLPFSESLPLERTFPELRDLSPHSGRFTPGAGAGPLSLRGHRMAVFICYEDLFPSHVRALSRGRDVELLVNLTNDSWFSGTDEPRVHLALAKLRAVEQRKYLVRATLTGKSAVIDPAGREIGTLREDREDTLLADVRWLPGSTPYNRAGDLPWWLFAAASIAYALWKRHRSPDGAQPSAPW